MGVDKPAGGRTWLTVNAVPFGTDGGSVVASFHDVTEARRLNGQILASLHEKEVMLREIHHRVKNNLAVIASLFHLQTGYVADDATRRLFEEAQARVRSMALVHEHLYTANDLGAVSFSDYANTLVGPTAAVALATDIRPVTLGVDQAIPCGLILNELVSNALKHGFPDGRAGTLTVGLCERDGACEVRVADDGAGIPPDRLQGRPKSLGLRLVRSLTRQLDGTVDFTPTHPGTEVRVTFAIGRPAGATHD
jgi:two-component sensor histidine kinase